jgi:PAS domain S-box-containing protein
MESTNNKKRLIIIFLFFSLVLSLSIIVIEELFFEQSAQKVALENGTKKVKEREKVLKSFLENSSSLLISLRESPFFTRYLTHNKESKNIKSLFLSYAQAHHNFMQIRYIDKDGNEIIRVDRDSTNSPAKLVTKENLQNKSNRYYFKDSQTKELEKVWFSAIDLNIENGKIQVPHVPVFRTILPIKHNNQFGGILVINYFIEPFLQQFTNAPLYDMILFNNQGYTVYHHKKSRNWGNSLQEQFNISQDFPKQTDIILQNPMIKTNQFVSYRFNLNIPDGLNLLLQLNSKYIEQQKQQSQKQYLTTVAIVFILSLILTFIIIQFYGEKLLNIHKLNRLLRKNKQQTNELTKINDNLEHLVKEKTKHILDQNQLLSDNMLYTDTDTKGVITDVSNLYCKVYGYSRDEFIGKKHNILKHPDMQDSFFKELWQTITQGKIWVGDIKNLKRDGTYTWMTTEIKPKFNKEGKIIGYVSFRSDITAKKDLEKQHAILSEQAKLASMGKMIGNIAHQWRQPLSAISILATKAAFNIESHTLKEDELLKDMNDINDKAQYLSHTIDTFKNFIKEDKKVVKMSLQNELDKAIELTSATLKNNYIIIKNDYQVEDVFVNIIEGEFIQVIINLINNAKDILIEKQINEPWIKISVEKLLGNVKIKIEDNGGGIPDDVMPHIFEPYFTTKHQSQGTGLGLHMSHQIITESLGGKLYASNTNNGAKFTIELPIITT